MRIQRVKALLTSAVLGGLMLPSLVSADEPGFARVSDRVKQTSLAEPSSVPAPEPLPMGADSNAAPALEPIPEGTEVIMYDQYGREFRPRKFGSPLAVWLSRDEYACTLPPDYGFIPPTKMPVIERSPVEYSRYWPNQWYGTPGMTYSQVQYPMVHTPTDTTQLGYTYQYVPHWRFNPNMLPPAPNPEEWQRRACPQDLSHTVPYSGKVKEKGSKKSDD